MEEALLDQVSLLLVGDTQGDQVLWQAELELGELWGLLDLDKLGVLLTSLLDEVTNVLDLLWL